MRAGRGSTIVTRQPGGCNGLSYTMDYAEEEPAKYEKVDTKGVQIFIEPFALFKLVGTVMDYRVRNTSAPHHP